MNGKWKIISGVVLTVFALFGGVWALNNQYVPREVYDLECDITENQIVGLSKELQKNQWLNQRFYWQQKVDEITKRCLAYPQDRNCRNELNEAIRKRDEADRAVRQLQSQ